MNRARLRPVELRTRPRREERLEAQLDAAISRVATLTETIAELHLALAESESRQAHLIGALRTKDADLRRALGREADDAFIAEAFR